MYIRKVSKPLHTFDGIYIYKILKHKIKKTH